MGDNQNSTVAEEWITTADRDLDFAKTSLDHAPQFLPQICFYFQQAAEKYLKAYIVANKLQFKKIHSLPALIKICCKKDKSFEKLTKDCKFLTEFYFEERYPDVPIPSKLTAEIAQEAKTAAEKIRDFVKVRLNL